MHCSCAARASLASKDADSGGVTSSHSNFIIVANISLSSLTSSVNRQTSFLPADAVDDAEQAESPGVVAAQFPPNLNEDECSDRRDRRDTCPAEEGPA